MSKVDSIDKNPLRGMRDFLPENWIFRKKLLKIWEDAAESSGFVRYETPVVEPLALLERKSGEEISDQIYNFEDKSGRKIALRPELTPSMVRVVSGNREAFTAQGKVYSIGQCFRYERASVGRKREHFQWNIDIVGEESTIADAYLIKTAVLAMEKIGLTSEDYKVRINNRQLVADFLESIKISTDKVAAVMGVMDKKDKISAEAFAEMLIEVAVSSDQIAAINSFMAAKSIDELKKFNLQESQGLKALEQFISHSIALGIRDSVVIDPAIVRGLAYYTGIVFEAFDTKGKYRAIFGGGRYDNLFEKLTGKACSAVGLGFGDVVIEELCKDISPNEQIFPEISVLMAGYAEDVSADLLKVSAILQKNGISSEYDFKPINLGKFLGRANKRNAVIAAYIGDIEAKQKQLLLKNLKNTKQVLVNIDNEDEIFSTITTLLAE